MFILSISDSQNYMPSYFLILLTFSPIPCPLHVYLFKGKGEGETKEEKERHKHTHTVGQREKFLTHFHMLEMLKWLGYDKVETGN